MIEIKSFTEKGVKTFEAEINGERIHWDEGLTYNKHIQVSELIAAQKPVSDKPDEILFITIHQTMELWIKLCVHEARIAVEMIQADKLGKAFKTMDRIATTLRHMTHSWEVLATLTPHDFLTFRGYLRKASGFQSFQYRELEFLLGNKNEDLIIVHKDDRKIYDHLLEVLHQPSLYDEVLQLLARNGFSLPESYRQHDCSRAYEASEAIEDIWRTIYTDVDAYWALYTLGEKLTAIEYYFQEWRFKHMKTVSRVIGNKKGTGGSGGVSYLVKALDQSFFPELWTMRTQMSAPEVGSASGLKE